MSGQVPAHIPYTALIQQFNAAPPGKLYLLHGSASVFRLSLSAAAHVLLTGVPMTLVDGTNRFDLYYLAEFARRFAQRSALEGPERLAGRCLLPEDILNSIFVSRAFTCYQMEALITDRLPAFVEKTASPSVIIFGLLDTFYDEQAPMFEVRKSLQRILTALHQLKSKSISVLLASLDVRLASNERSSLLPRLAATMDRVYAVVEDEGRPRILRESPRGGVVHDRNRLNNSRRTAVHVRAERNIPDGRNQYGQNGADIYNGDPAGDGKLVKVPARLALRRSGGFG